MGFKNKLSIVTASSIILLSNSPQMGQVFADSTNPTNNVNLNIINNDDIKSANTKIKLIMDKLETFLKDKNIEELDDNTIDKFFSNELSKSEEITESELLSLANKYNREVENLKKRNYSPKEIANNSVIDSRIINGNIKIEVLNNGLFTVENLEQDDSEFNSSHLSRSVVTKSAMKEYRSWTGIHIFTVSAIGKFDYNNSQGRYINGTNRSYIKRGNLSMWNVSNQRTDQGNRKTSSKGQTGFSQISGNLHIGFVVNGQGLVFQDLYVFHEIEVGRGGRIYRTMTVR